MRTSNTKYCTPNRADHNSVAFRVFRLFRGLLVAFPICHSTTAGQVERNLTADCTDDADKGLLRMTDDGGQKDANVEL